MNKEQQAATQAEISCIVNGLNQQLTEVEWQDSDGQTITDGDFNINKGTHNSGTKTQTTVLTVPNTKTTEDKTYKCIISSSEQGVTNQETNVHLKVFSKYFRHGLQ